MNGQWSESSEMGLQRSMFYAGCGTLAERFRTWCGLKCATVQTNPCLHNATLTVYDLGLGGIPTMQPCTYLTTLELLGAITNFLNSPDGRARRQQEAGGGGVHVMNRTGTVPSKVGR